MVIICYDLAMIGEKRLLSSLGFPPPSMSREIVDTISDLIILQENRLRMESEDVISALVQRVNQLHDALKTSNDKLTQKTAQLDWVFAQYIEMKDKVLRNVHSNSSNGARIQSHDSRPAPLPHRTAEHVAQGDSPAHIQKKRRTDPPLYHPPPPPPPSSSSLLPNPAKKLGEVGESIKNTLTGSSSRSSDFNTKNHGRIESNKGVESGGSGRGDVSSGNSSSRSSGSSSIAATGRAIGCRDSSTVCITSDSGGGGGDGASRNPRRQETVQSTKITSDPSRSKAARAALPGHECPDCKSFYEAMMQQGIFGPEDKTDMLKQCSRHKASWYGLCIPKCASSIIHVT